MREEFEEKIKALKASHVEELTALKASLGKASQEEIEKLKAKHREQTKDLEKSNEKLIAELNAKFDK